MISDRQLSLSLTKAAAWSLWAAVVVSLALGVVLHRPALDYVGLACSAAAATVTMRSFMCDLSARLQSAFEYGREVEAERQRELRSVP